MRHPTLLVAAVSGILCSPPTVLGQGAPAPLSGPPLDSAAVARWREDLAFLARAMPARHANLFHALRREQLDSALGAIRDRLPSLARAGVIVELMRLAAAVGDGHTNVSPWRDTVIAFHTLPIALYRFGDGYHVRAATREHAGLLGARIVRIGGVPIDSAEARVAPLIGRDNAMGVRMYAPVLLVMPEVLHAVGLTADPGQVELELEANGHGRTVRLAPAGPFPNLSGDADRSWDARPGWVDLRDGAPAPLWLSRTRETYWFTYVPEGRLLYCQINEIQERAEPFRAFFARALRAADSLGAEKFVLDLRLNGGGNGYYNRDIVRALVRSRFDERGHLFVITGRRTFSAAQMLISDLDHWSNPIFVGEPSASRGNHFGDSRRLVLPNNGVTVRVSTLWWQYWDPRDDRPWIEPDLAAPLKSADYRAGRDPALAASARYALRPSLVDVLSPLLLAGDSAAAADALRSFRTDPANAWVDPARTTRQLAGALRFEGHTDAALLAEHLLAALPTWTPPW